MGRSRAAITSLEPETTNGIRAGSGTASRPILMSPKLLAVLFFAVAIACDSHDSARAAKGSRTKCDVTVRNNSQKRILECRVDCGLGDVDLFGNMPPSALKED